MNTNLSTREIFINQETLSQKLKQRETTNQKMANELVNTVFEFHSPSEQLEKLNTIVDIANNYGNSGRHDSSVQFNIYQALATKFWESFYLSKSDIDPKVEYRLWSIIHQEPFFDENGIPFLISEDRDCHHLDFVNENRQQLIELWQNNQYAYPIQPVLGR